MHFHIKDMWSCVLNCLYYHPYLVSMLFVDLLSLHLATFLMLFILVIYYSRMCHASVAWCLTFCNYRICDLYLTGLPVCVSELGGLVVHGQHNWSAWMHIVFSIEAPFASCSAPTVNRWRIRTGSSQQRRKHSIMGCFIWTWLQSLG